MKWLTGDGVAAAVAVGAATWWGMGWRGVVLLFAFFVSSSLLTQLAGGRDGPGRPGGRRNARQVLANGGVAALGAFVGSWSLAAGALAAATADTWATELGSFSPRPPRLLTTGRVVPPGTSGGVTLLGSAGGAGGALFLAAVTTLLFHPPRPPLLLITVAGVAGMAADSLLGATLQGKFTCLTCGRVGEDRNTGCHGPMILVHGSPALDNDGVNLAATVAGAAVALMFS